jgi:hypothetical protein
MIYNLSLSRLSLRSPKGYPQNFKGETMQESTATIKLTKSEIEWNIIALVWMEKSSEEFRRPHDATMFRKLKKDFVKIKNDIIDGEKNLEAENKNEEKIRTGSQSCEECID